MTQTVFSNLLLVYSRVERELTNRVQACIYNLPRNQITFAPPPIRDNRRSLSTERYHNLHNHHPNLT
jgi:hypothetical protein